MNISFSVCKQAQPLISFNPTSINFNKKKNNRNKDKVVIVMGATGTGKSRLSIDLATHFNGEIINSDKIQVYKGLDIVTNKVTEDESKGITHHLLGIINPNSDFSASDFRYHASLAMESIIERDKLPIIAGGSNSFIDSLVNDDPFFNSKYECCFLWVDVSLPILQRFVSERVNQMMKSGFVEEVREIFDPKSSDYSKGIRRAIGVPELDRFLRAELDNINGVDKHILDELLQQGMKEIKENTYKLACRQLNKIHRLRDFWGWPLHRIDATEAFIKRGNEAWEKLVVGPSAMIVGQFLYEDVNGAGISESQSSTVISSMAAMISY